MIREGLAPGHIFIRFVEVSRYFGLYLLKGISDSLVSKPAFLPGKEGVVKGTNC